MKNKDLIWEIFEIEGGQYKRLPPYGIGFKKKDSITPEIIAYCFTEVQAKFVYDSLRVLEPADFLYWEQNPTEYL